MNVRAHRCRPVVAAIAAVTAGLFSGCGTTHPPPEPRPATAGARPRVAPQPASAPAPASPAPPAPPAPATPSPSRDAQVLLDAHNRYRAKHCAEPLTWSPELAAFAQQWANTLRDKGCAFEHSRGTYGENLAAGTTGTLAPEAVVAMWYDELAYYSFERPAFSMQTGHFTQVVWRGTARLGCAMSQCKGMDIWVCEYDPPGNWGGRFREHVLPATCTR